MKAFSSWGTGKTSRKRKRTTLKTKIRWDVIGLQDPELLTTTPSMEDIRSQIISMASHELESHVRSRQKDAARQPSTDAAASLRKRRRSAAQ